LKTFFISNSWIKRVIYGGLIMKEEYIIALDLSLLNTGYTICDNNFKVAKIGSIPTNAKDSIDERLDVI
jgi:hypothetical protein